MTDMEARWFRAVSPERVEDLVARVKVWRRPVIAVELHLQRLRLGGFTRRQVASEALDAALAALDAARKQGVESDVIASLMLDAEAAQAEYRTAVRLENDPRWRRPEPPCRCCPKAGQYDGFNDPGGRVFACPKRCSCHE